MIIVTIMDNMAGVFIVVFVAIITVVDNRFGYCSYCSQQHSFWGHYGYRTKLL